MHNYHQNANCDVSKLNKEIYNNNHQGFSENDVCFDYKIRMRNVLHDVVASPPHGLKATEPYLNNFYEIKMKILKKNFKPIFKKNSTKNYVSYNQILEYFK